MTPTTGSTEEWIMERRALVRRINELEGGLRNVSGVAAQFDADPDFRSIQDIADTLLGANEETERLRALWRTANEGLLAASAENERLRDALERIRDLADEEGPERYFQIAQGALDA